MIIWRTTFNSSSAVGKCAMGMTQQPSYPRRRNQAVGGPVHMHTTQETRHLCTSMAGEVSCIPESSRGKESVGRAPSNIRSAKFSFENKRKTQAFSTREKITKTRGLC